MIKVSVIYPNYAGARFKHDYTGTSTCWRHSRRC